jgi:CRP-like cAMP-binding protein
MSSLFDTAVALQASALFERLSAEALLPLAALCEELDLESGECLFQQGDPGDALYVIVRGEVLVLRGGEFVARLGAGQCVGELAVLDWETRSAQAIAEGSTQLIRLERNDLLDVLRDYPVVVEGMVQVLVERIRRLQVLPE